MPQALRIVVRHLANDDAIARTKLVQRLQVALFPLGMRLRTMLPGYTPRKYHVPEGIAKLSAHFTELAESTR